MCLDKVLDVKMGTHVFEFFNSEQVMFVDLIELTILDQMI